MCCRPHFSQGVEAPFVHAPVDRSQGFAQSKACPAPTLRDDAAAPTASHPSVRDDHDTPPPAGWDGGVVDVIWVDRKPEYFVRLGWTAQIRLNPFDKIAPSHVSFSRPFEVPDHGPKRLGEVAIGLVSPLRALTSATQKSPERQTAGRAG